MICAAVIRSGWCREGKGGKGGRGRYGGKGGGGWRLAALKYFQIQKCDLVTSEGLCPMRVT